MRTPLLFYAAAVAIALVACTQPVLMSTVASLNDKTDDFDGNWQFRKGTVKERCTGLGTTTTQLQDTNTQINLRSGAASDVSARFRGCSWDYDVSGNEAFVQPDQDCRTSDDSGNQLSISME